MRVANSPSFDSPLRRLGWQILKEGAATLELDHSLIYTHVLAWVEVAREAEGNHVQDWTYTAKGIMSGATFRRVEGVVSDVEVFVQLLEPVLDDQVGNKRLVQKGVTRPVVSGAVELYNPHVELNGKVGLHFTYVSERLPVFVSPRVLSGVQVGLVHDPVIKLLIE